MSQSNYTQQVARRVFAAEFNDSTHTFKESDDDRAPVFALLPTGQRANRVFIVGTVTEIEDVSDPDSEAYMRARVVGPTGTFYAYAGQYQPDPRNTLIGLDTPSYVAIGGKPRTFESDSGDINVSLRPEFITETDAEQRNQWVRETADRTLDRIQNSDQSNPDVQMAADEYEQSTASYIEPVIEALSSLDSIDELAEDPEAAAADDDTDTGSDSSNSDSTESDVDTTSGSESESGDSDSEGEGADDAADDDAEGQTTIAP